MSHRIHWYSCFCEDKINGQVRYPDLGTSNQINTNINIQQNEKSPN